MPIIVFTGGLGQGKTLSMTLYAHLLMAKYNQKLNLYANYGLKGARPIKTFQDLLKAEKGILCLDEAHISLDSRNFKDKSSMSMTHWLLQTRKADLVVMMTSQGFDQIDIRARRVTDVIASCEKLKDNTFKIHMVDWPKRKLGRILTIKHPEYVYKYYDTKERIAPVY